EAAGGKGPLEALRARGLERRAQLDTRGGERGRGDRARPRPRLPAQVGLGRQLARAHSAAARPRVIGGDDDRELVAGDGQRVETREWVEALDEADLAVAFADRGQHVA